MRRTTRNATAITTGGIGKKDYHYAVKMAKHMRSLNTSNTRAVYKTVIAGVMAMAVGSSGADGQGATRVALSLQQAVVDYRYTSIFDRPIQYMLRERAFDFVRRAAHETTNERIWAYVPGKLVLLGKETDSSGSVKANMELLTALMKENSELDLLHTHVKKNFSCNDSENPVTMFTNDALCRSQIVEKLKNSVPSPYDLSDAILAANMYNTLQANNWKLSNFVFTPISEVQYRSTATGLYRLKLRGDRALRTKMGMIGSYSRDFPDEIVPKRVSGILSVEDMNSYVQKLVDRYGRYKEFTMSVNMLSRQKGKKS